jgi:hypothetical protein
MVEQNKAKAMLSVCLNSAVFHAIWLELERFGLVFGSCPIRISIGTSNFMTEFSFVFLSPSVPHLV